MLAEATHTSYPCSIFPLWKTERQQDRRKSQMSLTARSPKYTSLGASVFPLGLNNP